MVNDGSSWMILVKHDQSWVRLVSSLLLVVQWGKRTVPANKYQKHAEGVPYRSKSSKDHQDFDPRKLINTIGKSDSATELINSIWTGCMLINYTKLIKCKLHGIYQIDFFLLINLFYAIEYSWSTRLYILRRWGRSSTEQGAHSPQP